MDEVEILGLGGEGAEKEMSVEPETVCLAFFNDKYGREFEGEFRRVVIYGEPDWGSYSEWVVPGTLTPERS